MILTYTAIEKQRIVLFFGQIEQTIVLGVVSFQIIGQLLLVGGNSLNFTSSRLSRKTHCYVLVPRKRILPMILEVIKVQSSGAFTMLSRK